MYRLAVFGKVATVGIPVPAEAAHEGFVVGVGAFMRTEGRFDAEGFATVGVVADKGFVARVRGQVVVELLMCDAAVTADCTCKRLETCVVLHMSVQMILRAERFCFVAAQPAAFVVTSSAPSTN